MPQMIRINTVDGKQYTFDSDTFNITMLDTELIIKSDTSTYVFNRNNIVVIVYKGDIGEE